uniref:Uncharacterized protein n=1 Tax=Oryza sativa subsp. japonica TaxID=39947 RepID=Q6ZC76_ORYSJ|nr:hypothetical protein [Oryza sativa Japonica Group]BAD09519.1 hypothetical protein [Oryza sativa Japonica Group]
MDENLSQRLIRVQTTQCPQFLSVNYRRTEELFLFRPSPSGRTHPPRPLGPGKESSFSARRRREGLLLVGPSSPGRNRPSPPVGAGNDDFNSAVPAHTPSVPRLSAPLLIFSPDPTHPGFNGRMSFGTDRYQYRAVQLARR